MGKVRKAGTPRHDKLFSGYENVDGRHKILIKALYEACYEPSFPTHASSQFPSEIANYAILQGWSIEASPAGRQCCEVRS